jgi:hypothetical protein
MRVALVGLVMGLVACGGAAGSLAEQETGDAGQAAPDAGAERQCQTLIYNPRTGYREEWGPCSALGR